MSLQPALGASLEIRDSECVIRHLDQNSNRFQFRVFV